MNRRHMTDDHHGRTSGRATLLFRAVDEILGTHKMTRYQDYEAHLQDRTTGGDLRPCRRAPQAGRGLRHGTRGNPRRARSAQ
jgi:hypothetical protein